MLVMLLLAAANQLDQDVTSPDVGLPLAHSIHETANRWTAQANLLKVVRLDIVKVGEASHLRGGWWGG